jgi:hypothetical protein
MVLASYKARCLPMQALGPAEKGVKTKGSLGGFSIHLSGLISKGSG